MHMNLNVLKSTEEVEPQNTSANPIVELIKIAICDELTASYQYRIAKNIARGEGYCDATPEYDQHLSDEQDHASKWLERLDELDVPFTYTLEEVATKGNKWIPITTSNVIEQLDILIKAEDDAAAFYAKVVDAAREVKDWPTQMLAKQFMASEIEHAKDLRRIRQQFK